MIKFSNPFFENESLCYKKIAHNTPGNELIELLVAL